MREVNALINTLVAVVRIIQFVSVAYTTRNGRSGSAPSTRPAARCAPRVYEGQPLFGAADQQVHQGGAECPRVPAHNVNMVH